MMAMCENNMGVGCNEMNGMGMWGMVMWMEING
jgi:hypothetical protein